MSIVTLLPVRNGISDLKYYFECVKSFTDVVLALDDGSSDNTEGYLREQAIVREIISNPVRQTAAGWDDRENRTRLLNLSKKYNPSWIVWLDSDEYIEPDEGKALKKFLLDYSGQPIAFGLEILRMIDDMGHYDKCNFWSFRVHTALPIMSFPPDRLHFEPVPVEISKHSRIKTNFQVKHRSGMSEKRRNERYNKYKECDPNNTWQESYENILHRPGAIKKYTSKIESSKAVCSEHEALFASLSKGR